MPALVIRHEALQYVTAEMARDLVSRLPDARLVVVPGLWADDPERLAARLVEFVNEDIATEPEGPAGAASALRTVLFTDLVGHTEMMQRLGDEKGRDMLREHERITREVLKEHGGAEVKTMGDGFMASFASVTKAVECAIALQQAFDAWNTSPDRHPEPVEGRDPRPATRDPLNVRVGLNAGEPIAEEGDLFGSSVIMAARVAAQAGPGEILVPDPVRHLLSGKGFLFSDRGEHALKGFEDPVRLHEVRWREEP
jgi:class 3 adenylate cyclase